MKNGFDINRVGLGFRAVRHLMASRVYTTGDIPGSSKSTLINLLADDYYGLEWIIRMNQNAPDVYDTTWNEMGWIDKI